MDAEDRFDDYPDIAGAESVIDALDELEADWKATVAKFAERVAANADWSDLKTARDEFTDMAEEALSEALYHTRRAAEDTLEEAGDWAPRRAPREFV